MISAIDRAPKSNTLPPGWRTVRFGDVVRNVNVTVDPEESGLERYVAGEHMTTDDLHIRSWGTIGDGYLGPAFHRKFVAGQVLYGSRRTYLRKVAVADFDGICANTTFVLEPLGDDLIPELLPFIMQTESFVTHSMQQSRGSTNPYVTFKDLAWYEFALPPHDEQRRIAEILWAADETVLKAQDVVWALQKYREVFFEDVIEQGLQHGWPHVTFSSLWTESPQSGYSAVPAGQNTGHYVLALSALTMRGYQQGELKPVKLTPEIQAAKLTKGDLLISRSNTLELVGIAGIFNEERDDVSFPDTMMRLKIDESRINKVFLKRYLLSGLGRAQIRRISAGTSASMKKINRVGLGSIKIPLPEISSQGRLMDLLFRCDHSILTAETKLRHTKDLYSQLREQLTSAQPSI